MYFLFLNVCRLSNFSFLDIGCDFFLDQFHQRVVDTISLFIEIIFVFVDPIPLLPSFTFYSGFLLFCLFFSSFLRWVLTYYFQPFSFLMLSITSRKPPSKSCFTCIPQFLICNICSLIQLKIF